MFGKVQRNGKVNQIICKLAILMNRTRLVTLFSLFSTTSRLTTRIDREPTSSEVWSVPCEASSAEVERQSTGDRLEAAEGVTIECSELEILLTTCIL